MESYEIARSYSLVSSDRLVVPLLSGRLIRSSGACLMLGGIAIAIFVLLLFPVGGFFGAEHALHPLWIPAHTFHLIGALLLLFGLVGLYACEVDQVGLPGLLGFVLAFVGTALFVGTGALTALVWPVVADRSPALVELHGALFGPPASILFALTVLTLIPGYLFLGAAIFRASVLPKGGAVLLMVGVVLSITPPPPVGPLPWAGLVVGGVLFGLGAVWLGYSLWSMPAFTASKVTA